MLPIAYPFLNGVRHDHTSIELAFDFMPIPFAGFTKIDYERTRERSYLYGSHPDPLGKTRGQNKYKGDADFYLAEWNLMQQTLGPGYGDRSFNLVVSYSSNGFDLITDVLLGCTWDKDAASSKVGTEGLTRNVDFNPLKVLCNIYDANLIPLLGFGSIG